MVVLGAGQMGLQLVLAAAAAGARVLAVEPLPERRELARSLGADDAADPDRWQSAGEKAGVVIVAVGDPALVAQALAAAAPGGRVVLFAGFGSRGEAVVDLNRLHYEEIALLGSEWIGSPPNQRRERYEEALRLLVSGAAPLERLVTARCGLDGIADAYEDLREHRSLKTVVFPKCSQPQVRSVRPAASRRMPASSVAPISRFDMDAPCVLGLLGFRSADQDRTCGREH